MKILKTASGRRLKLSRSEWISIGKTAGWKKVSDEALGNTEPELTPEVAPNPMSWNPNGAREESETQENMNPEDLWSQVQVSFEAKTTKYGTLTFVTLRNTAKPLASKLKSAGYKAFKNRVSGEWEWSKIVNKYKSTEIDSDKLQAVKSELASQGVDVSALDSAPTEGQVSGSHKRQVAENVSLEEADIPDEMIYWHNEMEAAQKLSPAERKKKYGEIIHNALEQVGDIAESDATSERSQAIIKSLLTASSKFHNYSFWNSAMIAIMKPMASYVASQDNWKRMGRVPKIGATQIPIMFPIKGKEITEEDKRNLTKQELASKGRTRFGYGSALAYEDTEPIPGWISKSGKYKANGPFEPPVWKIDSNEATEWLSNLYEASYNWATKEKKFRIESETMETAGGYASLGGKIALNNKSEGIVKVKTLFHEIAHQLIHFDPEFSRQDSTREDRETDAESTAYVVCSHYHIESKDSPIYLAGFGADKSKILARFNYIRKAAIEMFEGIDKYMSQTVTGRTEQEKEAPVQNNTQEALASAGNVFGTLGLFKRASVEPVPFMYECDNEDSKNII